MENNELIRSPIAYALIQSAIASAAVGVAADRVLNALAKDAGPAVESDRLRWKVDPGEYFSRSPLEAIAVSLEITTRTVKRALREARSAGLIEVRQCDATRRSYVWNMRSRAIS